MKIALAHVSGADVKGLTLTSTPSQAMIFRPAHGHVQRRKNGKLKVSA